MPYVLSEGVQRVAADNNVWDHLNQLPENLRPAYVDVLTFADLVATERAKLRHSQSPTNDDYFIGLAWTCMIPWSPPKPASISPATRASIKSLIDGAFVNPQKREMIRRALQKPMITLSKTDMEKATYGVLDMLNLPR